MKAGRLVQLRRGLYALAGPHRKNPAHPFLVANRLKRASYVSLQSALEFHGLIPDYVPSITSVTTGRPETLHTPYGTFIFRHIKKEAFFGYRPLDLGGGQSAFIASAEKALLDLLYLTPGSDRLDFLTEQRLQNLEKLDKELLSETARRFRSEKVKKSALEINKMAEETKSP